MRHFCLDGIDEHAAAYGGTGSDRDLQIFDGDHGVTFRCSRIENEVREIHQLLSISHTALTGGGVCQAYHGDDFDVLFAKLSCHFYGNSTAATRRNHKCRVRRLQVEVAQYSASEARGVFDEHGLPLAIASDNWMMECHGQFHQGIKPRKRAITRPHLFGHDAAMAGSKDMNHSSVQNGLREPVGGRRNFWKLFTDP